MSSRQYADKEIKEYCKNTFKDVLNIRNTTIAQFIIAKKLANFFHLTPPKHRNINSIFTFLDENKNLVSKYITTEYFLQTTDPSKAPRYWKRIHDEIYKSETYVIYISTKLQRDPKSIRKYKMKIPDETPIPNSYQASVGKIIQSPVIAPQLQQNPTIADLEFEIKQVQDQPPQSNRDLEVNSYHQNDCNQDNYDMLRSDLDSSFF